MIPLHDKYSGQILNFPPYETVASFSKNRQLYPSYSIINDSNKIYNIHPPTDLPSSCYHISKQLETHPSTCVKPSQPPLVASTVPRRINGGKESNPRRTECVTDHRDTYQADGVGGEA